MDKLTFKTKIGYGVAALGDAASYQMIATFLLFFLTTVAGIEPAIAGAITVIGSLWNTFYNPIMGYISDHTITRWGKRRVFMFIHVFPLSITIFLLFTDVGILTALKPLYYGIVLLIFWSSFTGFFIPYFAMGAEYTQDYHERTELRAYASFFNMIGSAISMVFPTLIVNWLGMVGVSERVGWSAAGIFVGLCTLVTILTTAIASKKRDKALAPGEKREKWKFSISGIFSEYWQVLKLKPLLYLLLTSFSFLIAYTIFTADIVYFLKYNQGMSATGISMTLLYRNTVCILLIPVCSKLSHWTDKRKALLIMMIIGMAGVMASKFIGIHGVFQLYIFLVFTAISTSVYWQLMPAIIYDVCEYDELITGNKRQGTILSVQGLVEALSAGIGAQVLGIALQIAGFKGAADVQSETTLVWIENCMTILPVAFLALSIIALFKYPITKERFEEIKEKLSER